MSKRLKFFSASLSFKLNAKNEASNNASVTCKGLHQASSVALVVVYVRSLSSSALVTTKPKMCPQTNLPPPRGLGGPRGASPRGYAGGERPSWLRGMLPSCTMTPVSLPKPVPAYWSFCAAQSVVRYVVLQYGRYTKVRGVILVKKRTSVLEQTFCGSRDRLRCLKALSGERVTAAALLRRKLRYHEPTDTSGKFLQALI